MIETVAYGVAASVLLACVVADDTDLEARVAASATDTDEGSSSGVMPDDEPDPADDGGGVPSPAPDAGQECPVPGVSCAVPDDPAPCCCVLDKVPPPGETDEVFECPIAEMDYVAELCGAGANFDCDDYAYACQRWANAKGIHACQVWVRWKEAGCVHAHAVTAIRRKATRAFSKRWSLVEPQNNHVYGSWNQGIFTFDADPPQWVADRVCGPDATDCEVYEVECDPILPEGSGEVCFTESAALCQAFEDATGVCSVTFEELP